MLYAFKLLFNKVEATKPAASRGTSAEIFVVCMGYKAPAKIDPRLLDPRHLFKVPLPLSVFLWCHGLTASLGSCVHDQVICRDANKQCGFRLAQPDCWKGQVVKYYGRIRKGWNSDSKSDTFLPKRVAQLG